jgi:diguanylate cyclase (GGDEF)-like protein
MVLLQNDILERVALGEPLADTARSLCLRVESILPDVVCSILTVDADGLLHPLAGPSLPPGYSDLIEGVRAGPDVGSCGAAIFLGRPVEAQDLATDPRWTPFAAMPLAAGLRACWSTPITGRDGGVLGAFAFYFRQARRHTDYEAEVVRASIHLCAIALERDQQAAAQHRLAYSDMLTDLPNRAAFNVAAERLAVVGAPPCGLLIVDLDNLKTVNDTFGHRAGDDLLRAAARFIEASARPHRAFRMGGDEFAILVVGADAEPAPLEAIAQRVLAQLATPVDCDGRLTVPRATIGGASGGGDCALDELQQNADFALYHAKETKRGGFVAYSVDLGATMTHRLRVIRDVGEALEEERVDAYYQPIVRIDTGEIVGLEALFRVITRDGQIKTAGDYFEATSDIHTATRLTRRMLGIVARDIRGWLDQGIWFQHIGFNLASSDFQHDNLVEVIKTAFAHQNVPLEHVILEVTEGVYMGQSGEAVARQIQSMRASGLKVALDDFGTGFASLTHLLSVPVDIIKIDKSFVARMEPQSRAAAIVEGLLSIAAKLGITVVAEGVETQSQADQLEAFGCVLGQGYLYSRAVDRHAITELLFEKAQKRDLDIVPPALAPQPTDLAVPLTATPPVDPNHRVVRYAVLLCDSDWRVVSERRQFGRFKTRSAAFQCALRLAQAASASGIAVELLHADSGGQLNSFFLPPSHTVEEDGEAGPLKRAAMN